MREKKAFTATVAVENERLVHDVPVNQINLTRRVSSEEPRDAAEHAEELKRFTRALLQVVLPAHPDVRGIDWVDMLVIPLE